LDGFLTIGALDIFRADPVPAKINREDTILGMTLCSESRDLFVPPGYKD
jgi:hypothetical protein